MQPLSTVSVAPSERGESKQSTLLLIGEPDIPAVTLRPTRLVLGWVTSLRAGIHPECIQANRVNSVLQPAPRSLNRVPALTGLGKCLNVTTAG